MAPGFGTTPHTDRIDQWLFLMQHHGAPTRLLDWTESPLIAAFFAVETASRTSDVQNDAAVYGLDPIALNKLSSIDHFPNTWVQNPVAQTIKFAFGTQDEPVVIDGRKVEMKYLELPVSIYPSTVHSRIASQRSCFTLHGSDPRDFEAIFDGKPLMKDKKLIKYHIPKGVVPSILGELSDLGITHGAVFPDLDRLARELRYGFGIAV
jgi:hypothetical protein